LPTGGGLFCFLVVPPELNPETVHLAELQARLSAALARYRRCAGASACQAAGEI